jgi:hypothetical protein
LASAFSAMLGSSAFAESVDSAVDEVLSVPAQARRLIGIGVQEDIDHAAST